MTKANAPQWLTSYPIAHRGLHDARNPENSLGAFTAAAAAGYAIELDIHCTVDDKLIVFHDDRTKRLTGMDRKVTDTEASVLQDLEILNSGYKIPLLTEVFGAVDDAVPILVEVKAGTPAAKVGPILARLLKAYDGRVAVQSFDPFIVSWFYEHAPYVTRGQLSCRFKDEQMAFVKKLLLKNMVFNAKNRPDFIAFNIADMPSMAVRFWLRQLGVPLLLWTVKDDKDLQLARTYGANIIFENIDPAS